MLISLGLKGLLVQVSLQQSLYCVLEQNTCLVLVQPLKTCRGMTKNLDREVKRIKTNKRCDLHTTFSGQIILAGYG